MFKQVRWIAPAMALALLTACAAPSPQQRAPVYSPGGPGYGHGNPGWGAQPAPQSQPWGRVERIERLGGGLPPQQGVGAGAVVGGVVGAVVGRQVGRTPEARNAGTLLGAVGGALIGHQIERGQGGGQDIMRVTVRFDDGRVQALDYAELGDIRVGDIRVGDRVRLQGGQLYRY